MKINTLFSIGDIVTFYPEEHYSNFEPLNGEIVDIFIYVHDYAPSVATVLYIVQSGEKGYNVYERQIVKGVRKNAKRTNKTD